jgi:LL-diaminopimelate aminotransferase
MYADRIRSLPPYLFAAIDAAKREAIERGREVIDLGVGDPDLPTPPIVIEALYKAGKNHENHQYPTTKGKISFRSAVADWYLKRFGVDLDPKSEVLTLIGSKEGLAHAPLAFINPGDLAFVPDPAYPVYKTAVSFAGGVPVQVPLKRENGFLPDLDSIDKNTAKKAKLIFLNYPNNPTASSADKSFFKELVDFAHEFDLMILHDNPYSEVYFDEKPSSILEVDGAKDVAVEFNSLSKTYNMTGWRLGFVVGNPEIIAGIEKVKSNIDSGNFGAVQDAGTVALRGSEEFPDLMRDRYRRRADRLYRGLKGIGLELEKPKATFYLWAWAGGSSIEFSKRLLDRTGIVATPGIGFGEYGEGYIRFSVTQPTSLIDLAVEKIEVMLSEESKR